MPSCRPEVIPEIVYRVMSMKPKTILDVGAGCGKWGVLCNEYLRYWCDTIPIIDGIEVFRGYESPVHSIYGEIIYDNVMNQLDRVGKYELVLAVDIIEHLTREDGLKFMGAIKGRYIISTPNYWNPQGPCFGNVHETHVSRWQPEDFENRTVVNGKYIVGWR